MRQNLRNLIAVGIAKLFYPERALQEVKVGIRQDEVRDGLEQALPYGFAHLPHEGAEALSVFPGGDKGFGLVISVYDRRFRMQLTHTGDVALYDHRGQYVHLSDDGVLVKSDKLVKVDAPKTEINGDITLSGTVNLNGDIKINGIKQKGD